MRRLLSCFLLLISFSACSLASGATMKEQEILTPDKIEKGMKGYGLTVFGGQKIERFDVVVLGVMKNRGPRRDLILVRASGGILEKSGVIAGMSGSPIYIENKLVGALAYAWGFSKEAIAGVQPIEAMFDLRDRPGKDETKKRAVRPTPLKSIEVAGGQGMPQSVIEPLRTPVFVSGFSKDANQLLDKFFSQHGLMAIPCGEPITAGSKAAVSAKTGLSNHASQGTEGRKRTTKANLDDILPGQAVAACLLQGDLSISAVGTLTHRAGNKILAFGHPFFNLGDLEIPLCRADVQTVLPSLALSFKMANTLEPIGTVIRDGETAIVGVLGQEAPLAEVNLKLQLPGKKKPREYHFEVCLQELLTPIMVRAAIASTLGAETKQIGPATLTMKTTVKLKGYPPFTLDNTFTTTIFPAMALSSGLTPLFALLNNSFEKVVLERVDVEVDVEDEVRSCNIEGVRWLKDEYEPGEELRGVVILRPHEKELTYETFKIKLPDDLPDGRLTITVASGRDHLYVQQKRNPGYFKPNSVEQLGRVYAELPDFTDFVVSFSYGRAGASLAGTAMPQLPPSMLTLVDGSRGVRFEKLEDDKYFSFDTAWVMEGKAQFTIEIKRNQHARRTK